MSRSTSFSSSRGAEDTITAPVTATMRPGESCERMWSPANSSCLITRTCQTCLELPGCIVMGDGYCVTESDGGDWGDDYRLAIQYGLALPNATTTNKTGDAIKQRWSFPALEAKYCPVDDETCITCRENSFWWLSNPDTRFCVGEGGCVCIMYCEAYDNSLMCLNETPSPIISDQVASTSANYYLFVFVLPVLIILGLAYKRASMRPRHRRTQATGESGETQTRREGAGISLSGWNKHRGGLIERENQELNSTAPPYAAVPETPATTSRV